MKYDDYARLSEENYKIMKQSYENVITQETADLQEILEKLIKQRETLRSNNSNNKYDEMLEKLDNNINDLNSLISGNLSQVASKNSAFIPNYYGLRSKKLDLSDGAISPIRSHQEMLAHGDTTPTQPSTPPQTTPEQNQPNVTPNIPQGNNSNNFSDFLENNLGEILPNLNSPQTPSQDNTQTPTTPIDDLPNPSTPSDNTQNGNLNNNVPQNGATTPNTPKRNSPMQGSALSNIIKQLNVGANRILGCNRNKKAVGSNNSTSQNTQISSQNRYNKNTKTPSNSQSQIRPSNLGEMNNIFMPYPMMPPGNDFSHKPPHRPKPDMPHGCEPHDIILSDQCDIVRMILLYMMLRPNCRYISRLCNVANDQFEILQLLM